MTRVLAVLISTMIFASQVPAPTDMSSFAITYVDVMPASKAAAVTAFKQYREMSRKDEGFVRVDLFEQVGRPGHLVIIETWASPKAFDTHAAATHTKQWRSKVDAIRLSDYDQRPYKPFTLGSGAAPATDRAIYVVAHVDIGGQGTNAPDLLKRLAEASRKEDGNLLVRNITFSDQFLKAIDAKNVAAQQAQQAIQEAERARTLAKGQADAAVTAAQGRAESDNRQPGRRAYI